MYCNRSFLIVNAQFPFFKYIFTCIGKGAAIIYKVIHFRRALTIELINELTSVYLRTQESLLHHFWLLGTTFLLSPLLASPKQCEKEILQLFPVCGWEP